MQNVTPSQICKHMGSKIGPCVTAALAIHYLAQRRIPCAACAWSDHSIAIMHALQTHEKANRGGRVNRAQCRCQTRRHWLQTKGCKAMQSLAGGGSNPTGRADGDRWFQSRSLQQVRNVAQILSHSGTRRCGGGVVSGIGLRSGGVG